MAKKKNKVAAGQERARQRARKKARYAGPSSAPASTNADETPEAEASATLEEAPVPSSAPPSSQPSATSTSPRRVSARTAREVSSIGAIRQRHTSEAMSVASGPSLRGEVLRIGGVTGLVGIAFVVLLFATELGR